MVKGTCKQERKTQLQQAGIASQAKEGARRRGSRRRLQLQPAPRASSTGEGEAQAAGAQALG